MQGIWVVMNHPEYGREQFKIKIIRKYNIPVDQISPKFSTRPRPALTGIYAGRNVSEKEIKDYLIDYYKERKLSRYIISISTIRTL